MRYLVLFQNDDGPAATLVEAVDNHDAVSIVDDFPHSQGVDYVLLIHEGSPVPDVYGEDGEPIALSDASEPEEDNEGEEGEKSGESQDEDALPAPADSSPAKEPTGA